MPFVLGGVFEANRADVDAVLGRTFDFMLVSKIDQCDLHFMAIEDDVCAFVGGVAFWVADDFTKAVTNEVTFHGEISLFFGFLVFRLFVLF